MVSVKLYVWHHTYFIYETLCTIHNVTSTLWVHTFVETTLQPLHSWHHTHYIGIHTWPHKSYTHHLTLYIWNFIHCICAITPRVSIVSHPLSVWHYTLYVWQLFQYAWHHMYTLWHHTHKGMTSHQVYLWHHIQYIWCHPYSFMKTIRLYLASHPLYLTSQPLHLCGHTRSINAFTAIMEVFTLGTRMTSYISCITSNSDFMTSIISI